jgi:hypothetical protein
MRTMEEAKTSPVTPGRRLYQRAKSEASMRDVVRQPESVATVPYLGPFLTDLTMVDEAHKTVTDTGQFNFVKRRAECDILAKLHAFQISATAYDLVLDPRFAEWFQRLPAADENEW